MRRGAGLIANVRHPVEQPPLLGALTWYILAISTGILTLVLIGVALAP